MGFWETVVVFGVAPLVGLTAGGALFLPVSPFSPGGRLFWTRAHLVSVARAHWKPIAGGFAIIALDVLETRIDPAWTRALGWDFTPLAAGMDGDLQARLQGLLIHGGWLQHGIGHILQLVLQVVYVIAFPFLLYFTPFLFAWADDRIGVRRAVWAISLCYVIAIPFYLFLPVDEVWYYTQNTPGVAPVENLVLFTPQVGQHLYDFDGLNNNFPSLHTALSCALALVAWQRGTRRFAAFTTVIAVLTVISTIVLGIHWSIDVIIGLALAVAVSAAVRRIVPADRPRDDAGTVASVIEAGATGGSRTGPDAGASGAAVMATNLVTHHGKPDK